MIESGRDQSSSIAIFQSQQIARSELIDRKGLCVCVVFALLIALQSLPLQCFPISIAIFSAAKPHKKLKDTLIAPPAIGT